MSLAHGAMPFDIVGASLCSACQLQRSISRLLPRQFLIATRRIVPRRTVFNIGTGTAQSFSARRRLPYSPSQLYALIADIESYPKFLPYCKSARVLSRAVFKSSEVDSSAVNTPTAKGKSDSASLSAFASTSPFASQISSTPTAASLTVGWGSIEETFVSVVRCVPDQTVEAIAGDAAGSLLAPEVKGPGSSFLKELRTRWTLHAEPSISESSKAKAKATRLSPMNPSTPMSRSISSRSRNTTEDPQSHSNVSNAPYSTVVSLTVDAVWKNHLYAAVSQRAGPSVADTAIEAFEQRAREILGSGHYRD